jgi:DNA-directed RNA polymerase subunit H (RpoH/RPB5)
MDSDLLDLIARTRPTIVEMLENRGYNVDAHKNESPADLVRIATSSPSLLRIHAEKVADGPAPMERCCVIYWIENPARLRVENEVAKLWNEENPEAYDPSKDEVIVVLAEPFHEVFHLQAAKNWNRSKARISFFNIKHLVNNPTKHTYVPPHRKLTAEEAEAVLQRLYIRSKSELPRILYHIDMQARVLGLVPGDIVEITRPSSTTGEYTHYRICSIG